ncbi:hypothetical protein OCU04_008237 [Sclerotinia nivalis]|uniref:Uncharacterized protein n=1 Tax=Sclerotinia nivalis TaxID=352851 RepID=A0A9X0AHS2_9HELO|nr:hypothetical protein OCU04_008237 [Sclerotinia nivalis]
MNATLASKLARIVVTATSSINTCRALNTTVIERFQRYDHEGGSGGNRTRQSAKTPSTPIKKAFAKPIEIESDDDDSIPNTPQKKRKAVLVKQEPVSPVRKVRRKV